MFKKLIPYNLLTNIYTNEIYLAIQHDLADMAVRSFFIYSYYAGALLW